MSRPKTRAQRIAALRKTIEEAATAEAHLSTVHSVGNAADQANAALMRRQREQAEAALDRLLGDAPLWAPSLSLF